MLAVPVIFFYDRACRFAAAADNRLYWWYKAMDCIVDSLHAKNHKACAKEHLVDTRRSHRSPPLKKEFIYLNTQAAEQMNSRLVKLKSTVSFMTLEHAMLELRTFLCLHNLRKIGFIYRIVGQPQRVQWPAALRFQDEQKRLKQSGGAFGGVRLLLFGSSAQQHRKAATGKLSGVQAAWELREFSVRFGLDVAESSASDYVEVPADEQVSSIAAALAAQQTAQNDRARVASVDGQRLQQRYSALGMEPRLRNVRDNGCCLFDSLVDQNQWAEKKRSDTVQWNSDANLRSAHSAALRQQLAALILSSELKAFLSEGELKELRDKSPTAWGTHVHLVAAADYFQREIFVLSSSADFEFRVIVPSTTEGKAKAADKNPFVLCHWLNNGRELHYGSLVPVSSGVVAAVAVPAAAAAGGASSSAAVAAAVGRALQREYPLLSLLLSPTQLTQVVGCVRE